MSDVKQSEMDRLYARRAAINKQPKYIFGGGVAATVAASVAFGSIGFFVVTLAWFVVGVAWGIWSLREHRRLTIALNEEQRRVSASMKAATRVEKKTSAAGHEPFIVPGALADHRNWRHGEAVEWHPDGTPRRVWDRYKVTDFQGAKMVGAIVEADEKLTDPPPTATLD
jgi:hypothetical protein